MTFVSVELVALAWAEMGAESGADMASGVSVSESPLSSLVVGWAINDLLRVLARPTAARNIGPFFRGSSPIDAKGSISVACSSSSVIDGMRGDIRGDELDRLLSSRSAVEPIRRTTELAMLDSGER